MGFCVLYLYVRTRRVSQGWISLLQEYTKNEKEHCMTPNSTKRIANCTVAWRRARALRNIDAVKDLYGGDSNVHVDPYSIGASDDNSQGMTISSWLDYVRETEVFGDRDNKR
jgi:hypothetical protein